MKRCLIIINADSQNSKSVTMVKKISRTFPKERIIILVDTAEEEAQVEKALSAGAVRYVYQNTSKEQILSILNEITR